FDSGGLAKRDTGTDLQAVVEKGRCLDTERGEYEGANLAVQRLTEGRTHRIRLHSIFDYPHTACSCFQGMAFYIPEVDGIGLLDKGYKGVTPDGRTWIEIQNAASGKQSSGFVGLGREYLKSRKFLQGDGGWKRVVWMPQKLKEEFARDKDWIATETNAKNLEELRQFLKDRSYTRLASR
ncbi:MAG: acetyl-CoA decarbonylase/synthase complex subunit beta, partial [Chloroflexi bacterium]|nr:acetyl-CoA decarbonylase/synthase complex subunit beta [Chloroflexota bacterium]